MKGRPKIHSTQGLRGANEIHGRSPPCFFARSLASTLTRIFSVAFLLLIVAACAPRDIDPQEPSTDPSDQSHDSDLATEQGIYGVDNRHELYAEPDARIRALADSTVALVELSSLSMEGSVARVRGPGYGDSYNLCASEPFREQESGAMCSGFLVSSDLLVTAGHCVESSDACKDKAFVFGYSYKAPGAHPTTVPVEEIYTCKSLLHSQAFSADFAVIKLDRPVVGHTPLKLRTKGVVNNAEPLIVIGHPAGIPLKIADGGVVRSNNPYGYFVTNLDTYGGNSGSAVFNARTLEVEGVLVRGDTDFVSAPGQNCSVSAVCANDGCRGEDVTKITEVISRVPALKKQLSGRFPLRR